ncbi:hypothetical protein QE152_g37200 [Popillia japonica]|uniref:Uncharacterized protein n=1 Tax=Popillia japonica TaxID=7064 RepID=A0AAW1IAW8_POPJA
MESEILIDGSTFLTNFYIVPNDVLSTHDIIGLELLKQAELIVDNNGVQINRLPEDVPVMSIEPGVEHEPDVEGIVLPYLDDLIIPSRDEEEGLSRLKMMLQTAKKSTD